MKTYLKFKQKLCVFVTLIAIILTNTVKASSPTDYFRSKQSGDWQSTTTWESSSDNVNWFNATITPTHHANTITIQTTDTVIINNSDTIDQTIVDGMLIYNGGSLYVNNGSGTDMVVNGIVEDNHSAVVTWLSSATWSLGNGGTMIKISTSNCNEWVYAYEGGISNIPSTSTWLYRKVNSNTPAFPTIAMTYPNLIIENEYSLGDWTIPYTGSYAHPTIKGNLVVGGNGTYAVVLEHTNTNAMRIKSGGDLIVQSGSTYHLYNNVGMEIQGNITINGTFDFSTYTPTILLSGNENQTIDGITQTWKYLEIDKSSTDKTIILNEALTITYNLTLTTGKIISSSSNLLIFNDGATVTSASNDAFVSGPVKKTGNDAFIFPVGKSSHYKPISISAPSNTAATYIAEYFGSGQTMGSDKESTLDSLSDCEYWKLDTVGTAYPVVVTLGWDSSTCMIQKQGLMRVARWSGSEWEDLGNSTSDAGIAKSLGTVNYFGNFILSTSKGLNIFIAGPSGYCSGEEIELTVVPINPVGTQSYSWDAGVGVFATTQTITVTPTTTTTYTVTYSDDLNYNVVNFTVFPIPSNICEQCIVRNGDFEYYESSLTSNFLSNIDETAIWYNSNFGSSDHFHSDYTGPNVGVPNNIFGTEDDHTTLGNNLGGYAGLWAYRMTPTQDNYREYISSHLNCKLETGQLYDISFWVSLGDDLTKESAGIGLYLSSTNIFEEINLFTHTPQLNATSPIGNNGWTELSLNNYSGGGEEYIAIGNFLDDSETTTLGTSTNSGGYIQGSYFYIDDVSITPVPPSIVADVPTTCIPSGTAVELTASGSPGYNWSWTDSGGNHSSTGSTLNVTPTETTTYTVTADIECGNCGDIENTYTITIAPSATISGGGNLCTTGSVTLTVTLTGTAPWDIVYNDGTNNITVTGITSSPYTFNAIATGTYTLVSVTGAGCSGYVSGSAKVHTKGGCGSCGSPLGSTTWGTGYTLPSGFYNGGGYITVNGNITLTDVILTMSAGGIISVSSGAILTLDHSHLYACGDMWSGIIVEPGGTLNIINGTLIEDAELAVYIGTPNSSTTLFVDNAIFNRNMDAIFIDDYQSTASTTYTNFDIKNTVFTCRTIPYSSTWPTVATLQTLTSAGTLAEHYTMGGYATATLKAPFATDKSSSGITLLTVGTLSGGTYYEMLIDGNNGSNTFNLFDNLLYGINANSSNFTCHNNAFQYIIEESSWTDGIAINATDFGVGYTTDNRIKVIDDGAGGTNYFYDCSIGVNIDNYRDITVSDADFRSTQMPISTTPPEGKGGIYINTPNCTQVTVDNNTITNLRKGIEFTADAVAATVGGTPYTNAQNIGPVNITNNTIRANYSGVTLTNEYAQVGIIANNLITLTDYYVTYPVSYSINVSNNHLYDVYIGISMSGWKYLYYKFSVDNIIEYGNRAIAKDNYIQLKEQTYPTTGLPQVGVYHTANYSNYIINNNVQGFGITGASWAGIYSDNIGTGVLGLDGNIVRVECNFTDNITLGNYFINPHYYTSYYNNTMHSNGLGFILDNASIGQQGNSTYASDNTWTGSYPGGTFTTFTTNGSDPNNSVLYTQSGSPYDPEVVGTCSAFPATPPWIYTSSNGIEPSTSPSEITCDALPSARLSGGSYDEDNLYSNVSGMERMERLVTENEMDYGIFPTEQYINAQHRVYRWLNILPQLKDSSAILTAFYTQKQNSNIAGLAEIEHTLALGRLNNAKALLSSITPNNNIEANYKNYYTAYLHYKTRSCTSTDSSALWQLVTGCAARDGEIIHQARSLYNILYQDGYRIFIDECNDSITRTLKKALPTVAKAKNTKTEVILYPNPATNQFVITFNTTEKIGKIELLINDVTGKWVNNITLECNDNKIMYDKNLENGVYFVTIKIPETGEYFTQKLSVIK